jgi:hypothetical protein
MQPDLHGPTTKSRRAVVVDEGYKKGYKKGEHFLRRLFEPTIYYARVAQWIRAFASGAKGRRFDPCRG